MIANKGDRQGCHGFTLMELIAAIGILSVATCCFFLVLRSSQELESRFEAETQGLVVLGNVMERLEAETTWDVDKVSRLLKEEFEGSDLAQTGGFVSQCAVDGARATLSIGTKNGKRLAMVELKK